MRICTLFLLISAASFTLHAQSITNTIAADGFFYVKDASTTFLTLGQANGYLELSKSMRLASTTGEGVGVIYKGAFRFIHDYKKEGVTSDNLFIGRSSGNFELTGVLGYNTAVGDYTLNKLTTGYSNTAIGTNTLENTTTGVGNTGCGTNVLSGNTTGSNNTAVGAAALYYNLTGYANTAIGYSALSSSKDNLNTALGYGAGNALTSGSNNTMIGYGAQASSSNVSNQITLGNNQISSLRCNVTSITSLSDIRDKKNIRDLSFGLDFLMKLKPRQFNWDRREWYENGISDGSKIADYPAAGFIAQELDEAQISANVEWLNLVLKDNSDRLEATPGNLLPIIVKAIHELKEQNDQLKDLVKKMSTENAELISKLSSLSELNDEISEIKRLKEELAEYITDIKSLPKLKYSFLKLNEE